MIELTGIYKHFGQIPDGSELPDYLPLMVDFLSLTAMSSDDPIREKLLNEYILPFLPPMRARLVELGTPYLYLLDALEKIANLETVQIVKIQPSPTHSEAKVEVYDRSFR
jgi:nitrate reductase delta subunit